MDSDLADLSREIERLRRRAERLRPAPAGRPRPARQHSPGTAAAIAARDLLAAIQEGLAERPHQEFCRDYGISEADPRSCFSDGRPAAAGR